MHIQNVTRSLLAAVVLSFSLVAQAQQAQLASADKCRAFRIPDRLQPDWTISADWLKPDVLVVADSVGGKLLHYSPDGKFLGRDPEILRKAVEKAEFGKFHPSGFAVASTNTTWIQMFGGRFVRVDEYKSVQRTLDLRDLPAGHDRKIAGVYDWTLAGDYFVGFGNFQDVAETWSTGFFSVSLDDRLKAHVVKELPRYPPERVWYRLGFHYLTSIGDIGYGITVDEKSNRIELVRIPPRTGSIERLGVRLRPLQDPPSLEDYTTPEEYIQLMKEVEGSTMPIGLYGWQDDLYLVWRSYSRARAQEWFVTKIELFGDGNSRTSGVKILGTMKLPTTANHLMVVPGPKYWALIEKGPVEGFGLQEERILRYVPSPMIEAFNPNGTLCR